MWSKIIIGALLLSIITMLLLVLQPETIPPPIEQTPSTPALTTTYTNKEGTYNIFHPKDWMVDETYTYSLRGPNLPTLTGVKFFIPKQLASSTNLSVDSGLSVETASSSNGCSAGDFANQTTVVAIETVGNMQYSIATTTDAGAGNFYEERVFAIPNSTPCLAIRYFIHTTHIANYDPGTIKEFDRAALLKEFDTIRDSLKIKTQ